MNEFKLTAEAFHALSKQEQRIVLAKDVIAILRAKKITARKLCYFEMYEGDFIDVARSTDIKSSLGKVTCEVCAIGGLFISEIMYAGYNIAIEDGYSDNIKDRLNVYFTSDQLGLIETAFENDTDFAMESVCPYEVVMKAATYCEKFGDPEESMINIMQNIIDHEGEFVP